MSIQQNMVQMIPVVFAHGGKKNLLGRLWWDGNTGYGKPSILVAAQIAVMFGIKMMNLSVLPPKLSSFHPSMAYVGYVANTQF